MPLQSGKHPAASMVCDMASHCSYTRPRSHPRTAPWQFGCRSKVDRGSTAESETHGPLDSWVSACAPVLSTLKRCWLPVLQATTKDSLHLFSMAWGSMDWGALRLTFGYSRAPQGYLMQGIYLIMCKKCPPHRVPESPGVLQLPQAGHVASITTGTWHPMHEALI